MFGSKLKEIRKRKGYTLETLAEAYNKEFDGGLNKGTLSRYENNKQEPMITVVNNLAILLNVRMEVLLGKVKERESRGGVNIPVLGRVAAGVPLEAIEDIIDYEEITEELARTGEFFALQINGDSMEPRFTRGDVVIVKAQEDAESEDIVIVQINGNDATCKKLKKFDDSIMLISTNPKYEPMVFSNQQIKEKPVAIIGRVVELRAKF